MWKYFPAVEGFSMLAKWTGKKNSEHWKYYATFKAMVCFCHRKTFTIKTE